MGLGIVKRRYCSWAQRLYWRRFVQFWRGDAFVLRGTARKPGEAEYERERDQHASMLLAVTLSTLGTVVAVAVWALDH